MNKRKTTVRLLSAFIIVSITLFACACTPKNEEKGGKMHVNGEPVPDADVYFIDDFVAVPFVKVLEALGFTAEWKSENSADIIGEKKSYVLDIEAYSFIESGTSEELFIIDPADDRYPLIDVEKEIYIDDTVLISVLKSMSGGNVYFSFNEDERTASITIG